MGQHIFGLDKPILFYMLRTHWFRFTFDQQLTRPRRNHPEIVDGNNDDEDDDDDDEER